MEDVALRKESVDRNSIVCFRWNNNSRRSLSARRAWIEICPRSAPYEAPTTSLSARRAWIEIAVTSEVSERVPVALRKESVDRNFNAMQIVIIVMQSLSARRAWIEI